MNRLSGFVTLVGLTFIYLFNRKNWGEHIAQFFSSRSVNHSDRLAVQQSIFDAQVSRVKAISSESGVSESQVPGEILIDVLKAAKKISYYQAKEKGITKDSAENISHLLFRLCRKDYAELHALINSIVDKLEPDCIPQQAYSQEGEDLVLARILKEKTGFFVDVGAHHPTRFSNTYKLYLRGWRGINIDPLPGSMKLFDEVREEDINLELAISEGSESNSITYYTFDEPAFNCVEERGLADAKAAGAKLLGSVSVGSAELSVILQEHKDSFDDIDLLTIDIEHHELAALRTFPFDKYQPRIVVIEIKGLDLTDLIKNPVCRYLVERDYKLRSYLFHSAIFVRS